MSYCGDLLLLYLHIFGFGLFHVVTILLDKASQNNICGVKITNIEVFKLKKQARYKAEMRISHFLALAIVKKITQTMVICFLI